MHIAETRGISFICVSMTPAAVVTGIMYLPFEVDPMETSMHILHMESNVYILVASIKACRRPLVFCARSESLNSWQYAVNAGRVV